MLNNSLKGFEPILDETGKMTGYKTKIGGVDTVFPFQYKEKYIIYSNSINWLNETNIVNTSGTTYNKSLTIENDGTMLLYIINGYSRVITVKVNNEIVLPQQSKIIASLELKKNDIINISFYYGGSSVYASYYIY